MRMLGHDAAGLAVAGFLGVAPLPPTVGPYSWRWLPSAGYRSPLHSDLRYDMAAPIDAATGELWYRQWASAGCTFRPCYWVWEDMLALLHGMDRWLMVAMCP